MIFFLIPTIWAAGLQPQNSGDETYSETYTAFADLNDGTYLLAQFLFSNAGMGSDKAGCRLLVVPKSGNSSNSSGNYSKKEWSATVNSLRVGPCSLEKKSGSTKFYVKTDKGSATLQIQSTFDVPKLSDSNIKSGKGFYEHDLLIPWGKVQVEYQIGGKVSSSAGFAQLDHTRSNMMLPKVAKSWFRFRGFRGEEPILAQLRIDKKGNPHAWLYEVNSKKSHVVKVNTSKKKATFFTDSGSLVVSLEEQIYLYKPVESYGVLGGLAKPFVGNPQNYTFRARATYNGQEVRGLVERVKID